VWRRRAGFLARCAPISVSASGPTLSLAKAMPTPLHLLWVRTREDQSGHDEVLRDGSRLVRAHSGVVRTGDQRLGVWGDVGSISKLGG
jgi:hypothetical protein